MKTYVFEGVMTAITSVSHIGDVYGINARLRREKVIQPDGSVEEVPIISGNAIRGILRDVGMYHMLAELGTCEATGLSLAAFYFLFSGGALTKSSRGLDVDRARQWRGVIPLVALFGGAMGNQIMPGKLKVGKAIPICRETAHLIPERFTNDSTVSIWDMCQEEAYTRRDDAKNENLRQLLTPAVRDSIEVAALAKRATAGTAKDVAGETGQKQQMRYYVETLAAGTRFYWNVTLDDVTDLEYDAFCTTLAEFAKLPYIGGKSGVGHGKVKIAFDNWITIDPHIDPTGQPLDFSSGTIYRAHLSENKSVINGLLNELK